MWASSFPCGLMIRHGELDHVADLLAGFSVAVGALLGAMSKKSIAGA